MHIPVGEGGRAPGMGSDYRRRRGRREQIRLRTSPAAQLRLGTRVSSPLHTVQATHVADRRPSDVNGPPTAVVKAARIGDPLHADLTEHTADRRSDYHASNSSSLGSTHQ
ncbi:hypothetical protein EVAR_56147_1 [Eumeta japonica]|uniref:Uncharacterized protein n=1 Tax=Eumeta variegata TaxID=151549 RepID=A0A4C1Y4P9_EUMVA|nr:hypothetical protein EVAR_56147_1 [Eumeta japonica]